MNDLAERMTWAVTSRYTEANHYPTITLKNARLSGKPGEMVNLSATTKDPDNDRVSVRWWQFENNGTYAGAVTLDRTDGPTTSFRIPADAKSGDAIHIIAEANDDGKLPLTRYARCIVTVR
jgi:cellulose-binding protein